MSKLTGWSSDEFEEFYVAYETARIWADVDVEDQDTPMSREMSDKWLEACQNFLETCDAWGHAETLRKNLSQAGHDFALSSQGHGVGFFAREDQWGTDADRLQWLSQGFRVTDIYKGDDGFLYDI